MDNLISLLTQYRPTITEVFLAALGFDGDKGFQCELGFGNGTTMSFQSRTLIEAINLAHDWALVNVKI